MTFSPTLLADYQRYADLIQSAINGVFVPFEAEAETSSAIQVERGVVYAEAMLNPGRKPDLSAAGPLLDRSIKTAARTVVDRTGHRRGVYRPLLVYGMLQAFRVSYETMEASAFSQWESGLRGWVEDMETDLSALATVGPNQGPLPAALGESIAQGAWTALALFAGGRALARDMWVELASSFMGRLLKGQTSRGTFLQASSSDNPETHWYHELLILHAAASYAVQAEDRPLSDAIRKNTSFHQEETQPDHATNQPWGLFGFVWNSQTRMVAEQMLHSVATLGKSGLASILLADALYCVRLFPKPQDVSN